VVTRLVGVLDQFGQIRQVFVGGLVQVAPTPGEGEVAAQGEKPDARRVSQKSVVDERLGQ
jgi:hypothetical protein